MPIHRLLHANPLRFNSILIGTRQSSCHCCLKFINVIHHMMEKQDGKLQGKGFCRFIFWLPWCFAQNKCFPHPCDPEWESEWILNNRIIQIFCTFIVRILITESSLPSRAETGGTMHFQRSFLEGIFPTVAKNNPVSVTAHACKNTHLGEVKELRTHLIYFCRG